MKHIKEYYKYNRYKLGKSKDSNDEPLPAENPKNPFNDGDETKCQVCGSKLVENTHGEDEGLMYSSSFKRFRYLECPKDDKHHSELLGYADDLDE